MNLKEYISAINQQYQTGVAREHAYRPALQQLLSCLIPNAIVTNEPARIDCGAPDYIILDKATKLPLAFVEAKDIDDSDLDGRKTHKEQFNRYKNSLDTVVFTDYLDFHLYEHGEWIENVRIGEIQGNKIVLLESNEERFIGLIAHIDNSHPQKITSASKLATLMASKARLLAETIKKAFSEENNSHDNRKLQGQYEAFKKVLIHDLTTDAFADIYAQTIAYGMFAARLHDTTPDDFSRIEAAELIPRSNPFLRQIFQSIAGFNIDDRISWIVDDLVATFQVVDVAKIMGAYSKGEIHNDPIIHFYEDFLAAYDPQLRRSKGVWYTPQPVVQYIVKSVDDILHRDFGLPMGLADSSKIYWDVVNDQYAGKKGEKKYIPKEFHKVQILDPAAGTGTFLAEVICQVYAKFKNLKGMWQGYVEENLIPRLNGFEVLMASYAVAHLKLDMLLRNTGYEHVKNSRFKVYLTNSLEEHDPNTGTLFETWLSDEALEANYIKRDTPVMVMIGNPPYSGISANNGEWITNLIEDYKKEPGGQTRLRERKIWLNDDYVKFLRLAQMYIDRTKTGVVAFINNNGFLDNPTFRGMRWSLMQSFDEIYILNLHGNSQKKETAPDGGKDENVFDITVGTSINIFVKTGRNKGNPAEIFYADLWGTREDKYTYLRDNSFQSTIFRQLTPTHPYLFFVPEKNAGRELYEQGINISNLFNKNVMGIVSMGDSFAYARTSQEIERRLRDLLSTNYTEKELKEKYSLGKNYARFVLGSKKGFIMDSKRITRVCYRPFDERWTYFDGKVLWRPREDVLRYMLDANIGFCSVRINSRNNEHTYFVVDKIVDKTLLSSKDNTNVFPLYVYDKIGEKRPNLNPELWDKINKIVGKATTPEDVLSYMYGVLYTPSYREKYKEFLKVDFPRVPYPENAEQFERISSMGEDLIHLHLMRGSDQWPITITFPESGDQLVEEATFSTIEGGCVQINKTQYFGNVSKQAWEAYIGGYQPAQKWLKDRKGTCLNFDDILHYGRILYALEQTERIKQELDAICVF